MNFFHNRESGHPFEVLDQNTKEIIHFCLLFHKIFCFGHNFWTDAYFSIPLSQVIHIFPVLRIDTNINHICGHINSCHNGQSQQNGHNGHNGLPWYGHNYGQYWCLFEEQEKCGLPVKAKLKNVRRFRSYSQNKIFYEKVAKNGRFLCILVQNLKWLAALPVVKKIIFIWYSVYLGP